MAGLERNLAQARATRVPIVTIKVTVDGEQLPLTIHDGAFKGGPAASLPTYHCPPLAIGRSAVSFGFAHTHCELQTLQRVALVVLDDDGGQRVHSTSHKCFTIVVLGHFARRVLTYLHRRALLCTKP